MDFAPTERIALPCGPIAFRRAGRGTPLLLIHGWRGSSRYWQTTLDGLADVRRIYAWDLPGHGQTPPRRTPIDIESLARLALDLADRWGLERFDLAGHSFGGAVALHIAAHWPTRVRRLAVVSMGTVRNEVERLALGHTHAHLSRGLDFARPWLHLCRPWVGLMQPWIDRIGADPAVSRAMAAPFVGQMPADQEVVREGVLEFLRADALSALEIAVASGSPAFLKALPRVTAPTLLLSGDADRLMPVSAVRALAQRLPGSRLGLMRNCGHIPMVEQPETYLRLVREFLLDG